KTLQSFLLNKPENCLIFGDVVVILTLLTIYLVKGDKMIRKSFCLMISLCQVTIYLGFRDKNGKIISNRGKG
ncbi:hypothetical protein, partial [Escherichia coli]|uniref:hypothetical protein n=1 Tax=Escherichia coli TaxID=562 RepID=UPI001BE41AAF